MTIASKRFSVIAALLGFSLILSSCGIENLVDQSGKLDYTTVYSNEFVLTE